MQNAPVTSCSSSVLLLAAAAVTADKRRQRVRSGRHFLRARPGQGSPDPQESQASAFDQVVWSAAEALGNLRSSLLGSEEQKLQGDRPAPKSCDELLERLRADYERNYFLTGEMDIELYAQDCEFSDPFTGFRGRDRFVRNLRNLAGGFITSFRVKLLDFSACEAEGQPNVLAVRSRLRVLLELGLPWRPTLGWVWGVTHECEYSTSSPEEQGAWRCVAHREAWEIDPGEGVAMVFRPGKGLAADNSTLRP
eukprot:TRINITY_DN34743_c0_g1_i1.p1 TRINITY_DN34743_c0_g1~~TRINITY_DN34743_c0_g1_i1.p1  ORF type:complete len:289 (-),score=37.61 TRINITY_DN34743_c0_g1_i1:279-1031(-)